VEAAGGSAESVEGKIRLRAPEPLPQNLRDAIKSHKNEVLEVLKELSSLQNMTLSQFEMQDCAIEVRVPWHRETLWFVPTEADSSALCDTGISRGRIFTVRELSDLFSVPGLTSEEIRTVTQVKTEFNGSVTNVRLSRSGDCS